MNIIGAKEISLGVDKILGCDSEVCDFDDETVYVNTGEESLDLDELLKLRKKYRIEAILVSDTGDDNLVLQIDIRTDEQRQFDKEVGEDLLSQNCER